MKKLIVVIMFLSFLSFNVYSQVNSSEGKKENPKVTFVELGSVNCIPCKQMQPVMKAVEEKFGEQVKVIFYDVWTKEGKPFGTKYGIKLIPTQVFLDENGKEFFRHEGFYPEAEIEKLLVKKGVKPSNKKG